jgi:hypothetical protein
MRQELIVRVVGWALAVVFLGWSGYVMLTAPEPVDQPTMQR